MPQRRSYAPTPMNAPQTGNTGRAITPPNLGQSASPLPPMPALPPGANAQPPPPGTPPSAPQPLSPMGMSGAGGPMSVGAGNMKPPVPTSIPLQPASPSGAAQNALGTGTVDPWDVEPFLSSHDDMSRQSQHSFRLPNESTTTSASLDGQQPDENDMNDDGQQIPMTLLKMMGALGR